MDQYLLVWIGLAVLFAVAELATVAFVALYFAIGAAAAAVVAGMDGGFAWQLLAFIVTAVALLAITRPFLKSHLERGTNTLTNVHSMVGKTGIVMIPIDNDANTGQIRVGTEYWTARVAVDAPSGAIPVDARVRIEAVEGVTARVRRVDPLPADPTTPLA